MQKYKPGLKRQYLLLLTWPTLRSTLDLRVNIKSYLTHLCEFHLQAVAVSNLGIKVRYLFCRRLDLVDDHNVRVDNDSCRKDETEDQDGHDKGLARHRGLRQPPVQGAGCPKWFWGVVSPTHQWHGGPEACVEPHKHQAEEGMVPLQPCA